MTNARRYTRRDYVQLPLSAGEQLELQRRREGQTQEDMASLLGIPLSRYRGLESAVGERKCGFAVTWAEWCYIARRRQRMTLADVAGLSGLAVKWVHRVERGRVDDVTPLVVWWLQHLQIPGMVSTWDRTTETG